MKQHLLSAALVVVTLLAVSVGGYALTTDAITTVDTNTLQCQKQGMDCPNKPCPNPGSAECCGKSCDGMNKDQCKKMKASCENKAESSKAGKCGGMKHCNM